MFFFFILDVQFYRWFASHNVFLYSDVLLLAWFPEGASDAEVTDLIMEGVAQSAHDVSKSNVEFDEQSLSESSSGLTESETCENEVQSPTIRSRGRLSSKSLS